VLKAIIKIQRAAAERLQEEYGESTPIHFPDLDPGGSKGKD